MPWCAGSLDVMPILGAHVDSSGGLHNAFERAKAMDADAIQCHPTPPGFWGSPKLDETRIATFKEAADKYGHPPFYFHARSEEHTSELQSHHDLVCRLLLEKKKA